MRRWLTATGVALGIGAGALAAAGVASAAPDADTSGSAQRAAQLRPARESRSAAKPRQVSRAAALHPAAAQSVADRGVSVTLPPLPVREGSSFTISGDAIGRRAAEYIAGGGDPADTPRFFLGDLAVVSLTTLADLTVSPEQSRLELGNLTASGYFGGLWLRDNLRDSGAQTNVAAVSADLTVSAVGIRLFDALASGLMHAAASPRGWVVRSAAHASVPVLLALYGYNRGYLEVLLENPPPGVTPNPGSLGCDGFINCDSSAFPLEIGTRYDVALGKLANPPSPAWAEMAMWTSLLQRTTGTGRFVWELIAGQGAFSPASYEALVELSSAYLMISKAAVLSSMLAYADGDTELGRSSLRLQAGLWMWSGGYFAGLASGAPAGTAPAIVVGDVS